MKLNNISTNCKKLKYFDVINKNEHLREKKRNHSQNKQENKQRVEQEKLAQKEKWHSWKNNDDDVLREGKKTWEKYEKIQK